MKNIFLVDTNFFIQAHRVSYPFDVVPSFWNKVKNLVDNDKIISIDKVKDEIYRNEDDLKKWCRSNLKEEFWHDTSEVSKEYSIIARWAVEQSERYTPNAINEFLGSDNADAFLIAYALAEHNTRIVVTYEVPNMKRSIIKIPDVCNALEINYLDPIAMFRKLNESF